MIFCHFSCVFLKVGLLFFEGGFLMKNKKKVVSLFVSAALFGGVGIYTGVTGDAPAWLPVVLNVLTILGGAFGITFVAPNGKSKIN